MSNVKRVVIGCIIANTKGTRPLSTKTFEQLYSNNAGLLMHSYTMEYCQIENNSNSVLNLHVLVNVSLETTQYSRSPTQPWTTLSTTPVVSDTSQEGVVPPRRHSHEPNVIIIADIASVLQSLSRSKRTKMGARPVVGSTRTENAEKRQQKKQEQSYP